MLASVVSAVYYLRVLVVMWMKSSEDAPEAARSAAFLPSTATMSVVAVCALGLLLLGIVPGHVISLARTAVEGAAALAVLP